jgi:hypothetical protein
MMKRCTDASSVVVTDRAFVALWIAVRFDAAPSEILYSFTELIAWLLKVSFTGTAVPPGAARLFQTNK